MNLLAQREHSKAELKRKLSRRFSDNEHIAATIDQLNAQGLQSDARFSEAFVSMRSRKGQGPVRIRLELKERGISTDLIDRYLDEDDEHWVELAREVHRKRFSEIAQDRKEQARQMRFLQYRGFNTEQIRHILDT